MLQRFGLLTKNIIKNNTKNYTWINNNSSVIML